MVGDSGATLAGRGPLLPCIKTNLVSEGLGRFRQSVVAREFEAMFRILRVPAGKVEVMGTATYRGVGRRRHLESLCFCRGKRV